MTAKAVFSRAASVLRAHLARAGFRKTGSKFVRTGPEALSVIELQPSRGGSPDSLRFVVNYGVIVRSLLDEPAPAAPTYTECHWGGRVAGADGVEIWWPVRTMDDADELADRLRAVIERDVLPSLDRMQTEESAIRVWQSGQSPLLVEAQRLFFLGRLLHKTGRHDEFAKVLHELEAKSRDAFGLRMLESLRGLERRAGGHPDS